VRALVGLKKQLRITHDTIPKLCKVISPNARSSLYQFTSSNGICNDSFIASIWGSATLSPKDRQNVGTPRVSTCTPGSMYSLFLPHRY